MLKTDAKKIYTKAIEDSLPDAAVRSALADFPEVRGRILLISIGKAAWQMAACAHSVLGEKINTGAAFMKKSALRAYVLRTTSLVLLLVIFSTLLASCHGRAELNEFDIPTAFDDTKQYEIIFWAKNESNAYQKNVYERAAAEFEALYPNVDVKIKIYTNYGDVYKDVITNIPTNTTPNVCITYPDHIATYLEGENTVVCLDELMRDKRFGLGGKKPMTQREIAEEMGISRSYVSRIENAALEKLRRGMGS